MKEEMLEARLGDNSTGCDSPCGVCLPDSAGEVA